MAIGAVESNHGRSHALGVQTGVNAFGCCSDPMQFDIRDGPSSTWQIDRVDGDDDGATDLYAPASVGCAARRRDRRDGRTSGAPSAANRRERTPHCPRGR